MISERKMRLSGNSIAWTGSFIDRTKTYHYSIYNRKNDLFLVNKFRCGNRGVL